MTIVGVVSNIFIGFLVKLRLRIPKVGIIRNEIYFFGFYRCVNSGELLTNLTIQFVSDSPEFTHR